MSYIRKHYKHFIAMQNGNMELVAVIYWYGIGLISTAGCERGQNSMSIVWQLNTCSHMASYKIK